LLLSLTEPPINTLKELSEAMRDSGLQLLVEVQSASQAMLEVSVYNIYYTHFGWKPDDVLLLYILMLPTYEHLIKTHTSHNIHIHINCVLSRTKRLERHWRLRRVVTARDPSTRIPNRVYRERNAISQGQQELRRYRRSRDVLLRYQTIW